MFDVNHVSSMLKSARIKKNYTQGVVAEKIGVSFQAVSNWERGNSLPDLSNLANICSILDIDLYELVGASRNNELVDQLISGTCDLKKVSIRVELLPISTTFRLM